MSTIRDRVVLQIANRVKDPNKLFTAYDVTQALRAETPNEMIPHQDMRRLIRGLFNGQDPCFQSPDPNDPEICTPALIGGQDVLVYHRLSRNANEHPAVDKPVPATDDDDDDDGFPKIVLDTNPAGFSSATQPPAPDDSVAVSTTLVVESEGRLNVPSALVRSLGLKPGDDAAVNIDAGKIVITAGGTGYVYTVTVRGNIRLRKDLLAKIAPAGHFVDTFDCETSGSTIIISAIAVV